MFTCIVTTNKALRTRKFVSICLTKVNAQDMTLHYGIFYKHSHMTVLSLSFFSLFNKDFTLAYYDFLLQTSQKF